MLRTSSESQMLGLALEIALFLRAASLHKFFARIESHVHLYPTPRAYVYSERPPPIARSPFPLPSMFYSPLQSSRSTIVLTPTEKCLPQLVFFFVCRR